MPSPVRVWPVLQEYVATELYVVVETDTIPFAGSTSVPQSTTADTRKIRKNSALVHVQKETHSRYNYGQCSQMDSHTLLVLLTERLGYSPMYFSKPEQLYMYSVWCQSSEALTYTVCDSVSGAREDSSKLW